MLPAPASAVSSALLVCFFSLALVGPIASRPLDGRSQTICTADINEYGFPSMCQCGEAGLQYDSSTGRCELPSPPPPYTNWKCTRNINQYGFPSVCECPDEANAYNPTTGLCAPKPATAQKIVEDKLLACTMDLNEYGFPSICECPETSPYDPMTGLCVPSLPAPTMKADDDDQTPLPCTMDTLNEYGFIAFANLCVCPETSPYDPALDRCAPSSPAPASTEASANTLLPYTNWKCTRNINQYGFPSVCECPDKANAYDPTTGLCAPVLATAQKAVEDKPLACTMDLNEYGFPSVCECPDEANAYDPSTGLCVTPPASGAVDEEATTLPLACTMDVNEFGFPSVCVCPESIPYDPSLGRCAAAGLPCTADLNENGHSSSCQCPGGKTYDPVQGVCA